MNHQQNSRTANWECTCGTRFLSTSSLAAHIRAANAIPAGHTLRHGEDVFEESLGVRVAHYTCSCGELAIGEVQRDEHLRAAAAQLAAEHDVNDAQDLTNERDSVTLATVALSDAYARGFVEASYRTFDPGTTRAARHASGVLAFNARQFSPRQYDIGKPMFDSAGLAGAIDGWAAAIERGIEHDQIIDTATPVIRFARELARMIRDHGGGS